MKSVESSSIEALGHDPAAQRLTVRFKSGATYHYDGVSPAQHTALMNAKSIGGHFAAHIRNHFDAIKT